MLQGLGIWDWAALAGYFAILLGTAWWVVLQKNKSSRDYFLAGKNAGWFVIGASLFASNIGSEHLVGLAGTGARDGMAMAHYELHAWCLLVLGWLMVPFYTSSGVYTMPEFLERRYCAAARWFLSLFSLLSYIFTKISVTLFAGGIVFKALSPDPIIGGLDNFWFGALFMVVLTGLYTIAGGMRAVLYTEAIQTVVLLAGAGCVLVIGLHQAGGWQRLRDVCQDSSRMVAVTSEVELAQTGSRTLSGLAPERGADEAALPESVSGAHQVLEVEADHGDEPVLDLDVTRTGDSVAVSVGPDEGEDAELDITHGGDSAVVRVDSDAGEEAPAAEAAENGAPKTGGAGSAEKPKKRHRWRLFLTEEKLDFFNLWKPNDHPAYPWFGLLFGAPIVGLWYWCTDQYIVQRTLTARNQTQARRGTIFGAYLKMFPVFLFIVPGMVAYGIAAQGDARLFPVLTEGGANQAFPLLVKHVLPVGLKGVVIGGLLAALMSSLASVFNSCSTLFTIDIYKKLVPNASETHLVWVGRLATSFIVLLGILWIPVVIMLMKGSLYNYLQSVQSYIGPPIAAVFFLGIFCKRVNAAGCMAGLGAGFLLGAARLTGEILSQGNGPAAEAIAASPFLSWFTGTSFTFMAIWLTVVSAAVIVGVSLLTPKPPKEKTDHLTWSTRTPEQRAEVRAGWNKWDVIASLGLIVCILLIYAYFTGNMLR